MSNGTKYVIYNSLESGYVKKPKMGQKKIFTDSIQSARKFNSRCEAENFVHSDHFVVMKYK